MPYLRATRTSLIRRMPLGMYLYFPSSSSPEAFSPVMEIDESTEELLELCDGLHTREDILQKLSEESGESTEAFAADFDAFIQYLVNEGVLEWTEVPSYVEPLYKRNKPLRILAEITSVCSLQCPFCSVDAAKIQDDLTMDDIILLVDQMKKLKPTLLVLSGGEPLLKKDMVFYMVEELSPIRELDLYIFTNCTVLTKEYAQQLYDAGLRFVRVSVDGHTAQVHDAVRGKGTFEKTVQGIEHLKDVGINVTAVPLISRLNYQYFKEIKEFVSQIADSYNVSFDYPCGKAAGSHFLLSPEDRLKITLLDLGENIETGIYPQNRCNIGEMLYITSSGDCFPCLYMHFPEFNLGNVKKNSITDIYTQRMLQDMLELTVDDIEDCRNCDIRYYCRGGCRGFAYGECGSLYALDPLNCEVIKGTARRILECGEENTQQLMRKLIKSTQELR